MHRHETQRRRRHKRCPDSWTRPEQGRSTQSESVFIWALIFYLFLALFSPGRGSQGETIPSRLIPFAGPEIPKSSHCLSQQSNMQRPSSRPEFSLHNIKPLKGIQFCEIPSPSPSLCQCPCARALTWNIKCRWRSELNIFRVFEWEIAFNMRSEMGSTFCQFKSVCVFHRYFSDPSHLNYIIRGQRLPGSAATFSHHSPSALAAHQRE